MSTKPSRPTPRFLTALPVYNERGYVNPVLDEVLHYSPEVLVVDDGSSDGTGDVLRQRRDVRVVHHRENQGYGAALATAFRYAIEHDFEVLVTIDCDGQHQPCRIPDFVEASRDADIVSGSRYLQAFEGDSRPPAERLRINQQITAEVNERLNLQLTDAFCGFKAYRRSALETFTISELGYAMPLEVWAQAAFAKLKIVELPVHLIYLDLARSFGGALDEAAIRLDYYRLTLNRCISEAEVRFPNCQCGAPCGKAGA